MKGFALIVLCAIVAAQARHTSISTRSATKVALGENPWVVHLRIAVSTSGILVSCVGTLIDSQWVLTAGECVTDARFIWVRYGVVNVINPSLVTEASIVRVSSRDNGRDLGLINLNRVVHSTGNISPVSLSQPSDVTSGKFCGFGANEQGEAGEILLCADASVEQEDGLLVATDDLDATEFDLGAGLVVDGVQVGVLVKPSDGNNAAGFVAVADFLEWIESETGLALSPEDGDADDDEASNAEDALKVHFVN